MIYASLPVINSATLNGYETLKDPEQGQFSPGLYKVTPLSRVRVLFHSDMVSREATYNNGVYTYTGNASGNIGYSILASALATAEAAPDFGNLGERALLGAYSKIADCEVALGENLGELRETLSMFKSPFKTLRDFLGSGNQSNLRKLNSLRNYVKTGRWGKRTGSDAADAASATWLEIRYGLMPIIYTIQDLIKLANKKASVFDPTKIRSKIKRLKDTDIRGYSGTVVTGNILSSYEMRFSHSMKAHASVQYLQDCPQTLPDKLGLTPRFIPELAWELTKASFIVDWWLEVGTWLGAMRITPFVSILGHTVGLKSESTGILTENSYKYNNSLAKQKQSGVRLGVIQKQSFTRTVGQHLPYLPQSNLLRSKSYFRTIDGLTLTWQLLLRKMR